MGECPGLTNEVIDYHRRGLARLKSTRDTGTINESLSVCMMGDRTRKRLCNWHQPRRKKHAHFGPHAIVCVSVLPAVSDSLKSTLSLLSYLSTCVESPKEKERESERQLEIQADRERLSKFFLMPVPHVREASAQVQTRWWNPSSFTRLSWIKTLSLSTGMARSFCATSFTRFVS